jgi:hypothetical protein
MKAEAELTFGAMACQGLQTALSRAGYVDVNYRRGARGPAGGPAGYPASSVTTSISSNVESISSKSWLKRSISSGEVNREILKMQRSPTR